MKLDKAKLLQKLRHRPRGIDVLELACEKKELDDDIVNMVTYIFTLKVQLNRGCEFLFSNHSRMRLLVTTKQVHKASG